MGLHFMTSLQQVPYQLEGVCLFTFDDLCGKAIGTSDYIGLANAYHTVFLYDVPNLENFEENPNEIRRFIQLLDVLYERLVRVIFDSRVPLLRLFGTPPASRVS